MRHRITARAVRNATAPRVETDTGVVSSFLSDAAHVEGGFAPGIAFPRTESEVAGLLREAGTILPVGARSSLTGGATPRGEIVLSTRALATIGAPEYGNVRVGAGVVLSDLERSLALSGWRYPPVPTFEGAFVGGTIATNAAGAATFKYGSTRDWVEAVTVVLADGDVLDIERGAVTASRSGTFEIELPSGEVRTVAVPAYAMPPVAKLSAGYYARPGMDLIDLFIGSEGTLGIIVAATLRLVRRSALCLALVRCTGDEQALAVTAALRAEAEAARRARAPLDVAAVEYMDANALRHAGDEAVRRAGIPGGSGEEVTLLVQIEIAGGDEAALSRLQEVLAAAGVAEDPIVALPGDDRGAQRLFSLREAVPAGVNAAVAAAKLRADRRIEKTAGDMIVPFERLGDSLRLYRQAFERRRLDYAVWGHFSDGNLHPNVVPRDWKDVESGREAILEVARGVIAMGGAPLAEHGVGRSPLKQRLLRELYGDAGVEEMRAVKRALDPEWKLAPGVLFE